MIPRTPISITIYHLGVQIYDAHIPPPLALGSLDEVVLNCDYDLREEERGQLDIKW